MYPAEYLVKACRVLALAGLVLVPAGAAAQTAGTDCGALVRQYDEAIRAANGLVQKAVEEVLKGTDASGVLGRLGIGGNLAPEEAVRRGALAALPPPTQSAILIHLLRANTAMEALAWKSCQPPAGSN